MTLGEEGLVEASLQQCCLAQYEAASIVRGANRERGSAGSVDRLGGNYYVKRD
jgi:hypothetical protein